MNTLIQIGTLLVFIALTFYSIALRVERKRKIVSKSLLATMSLGLIFDISATCFMIAGSSKSPFTLHGAIGYSALFLMCVDVFLLWNSFKSKGLNSLISDKIHQYTLFAYCWWIVAFISGGIIASMAH